MSVLMDTCPFCPEMFPNDGDSIASAGSLLYFAILTFTKSSLQPNLKLPRITSSLLISAFNDHEHEERIVKKMKRTIAFKIF